MVNFDVHCNHTVIFFYFYFSRCALCTPLQLNFLLFIFLIIIIILFFLFLIPHPVFHFIQFTCNEWGAITLTHLRIIKIKLPLVISQFIHFIKEFKEFFFHYLHLVYAKTNKQIQRFRELFISANTYSLE